MLITKEIDTFRVSFNYNAKLVDAVKCIQGRAWNGVGKYWTIPLSKESEILMFAKKYGFKYDDGKPKIRITYETKKLPEPDIEIPSKLPAYPFQLQGVMYNLLNRKTIVGDLPGLGKTMQAILTLVAANLYEERFGGSLPALIVCPASLKINWEREVIKWSNLKPIILQDANKLTWQTFYQAGMRNVFIVNYESLKKFFVLEINKKGEKLRLTDIKFDPRIKLFKTIIIDEAHRVKSTKNQATKIIAGISKNTDRVHLLTGTPIVNKTSDLISLLGIMNVLSDFGGYKVFNEKYCIDNSNVEELQYLLKSKYFYQRGKKEVLKDLPDKTRVVIECDITNRKEYTDAEDDLIEYLRSYKQATDEKIARSMRGEVMVRIGILRQISARGKINDVVEFITDILESGEKYVLFAHHKEIIDAMKKHFPHAVTLTGSDSLDQRQKSVDGFQNNPEINLILCSMNAAGVGITLTASSNVGFIEFPWTDAICVQCEDRCHRIGSKDNVTASYFLGSNTYDVRSYEIIQNKRDLAVKITGTDEQIEETQISFALDYFKNKL